jgi:folate-binding protein YgfZ
MVSETFLQDYDVATTHAAVVDRAGRGWIVVSGKDRASYLQGLLTNDIVVLTSGSGCYSAYLTPQGRMIADLWVYELGDVILLAMSLEVKDTILSKLDQFIFSEDVQLGDVSSTFAATAVIGPSAATAIAGVFGIEADTLAALPEHGNLRTAFEGQPVIVLATTDLGRPGFDLLVEASVAPVLRDALRAQGTRDIGPDAAEVLRIEGGVAKFHQDMDEETIPLEAGIESRAISLTKGCYVGQEVIIRVLHRGHGRVARKLVGFSFAEGDAPARGTIVQAGERTIGEVTSSSWSPAQSRPIALGYVQRDFVAPGTSVTIDGRPAEVVALPFARQ